MMMMSGKFCDLDHKALITGKCLKVTSGILPVYIFTITRITRLLMIFLNKNKAVNIFDRFQADHSISIHPHFCPSQCLVSQPRVGKKRKQSICKMCSIHKVRSIRFWSLFTIFDPSWAHLTLLDLVILVDGNAQRNDKFTAPCWRRAFHSRMWFCVRIKCNKVSYLVFVVILGDHVIPSSNVSVILRIPHP